MTDQSTLSWDNMKSSEEANANFVLQPADAGYVLEIVEVGPPTVSPFPNIDPQTGEERARKIQTKITFEVVSYDDESFVGSRLNGFFTISLHTKSNFYKLVKAAFGGDVDPKWKPNPDDLLGKTFVATIGHKDPNTDGYVYPKIESFAVDKKAKSRVAPF
jgi:hypothetical protein